MQATSFISIVFLCIAVLNGISSLETNRTYLIKKDFLSGLKGGEFTIYDSTGKKFQYRMESKVGVTHDVQLFEVPSKKLLARLKAKITAVMYKATISIFDDESDAWANGTIGQNFKIVGNKFTIGWKGETIFMEGGAASLNTAFVGQSKGDVYAKFHKRVSSLFWRNKYDLQVLSNKYPDALYFLALAARDHSNKKIHRG